MKKRFYQISYLNNENGYTLIIVILTLVVMTILGLGLMGTTANTLKSSSNERDNQSAYYIAEAGLVQKRGEIKEKLSSEENINEAIEKTNMYYNSLSESEKESFNYADYAVSFILGPDSTTTYSSESNDFEEQFNKVTKATVKIEKIGTLMYKVTSEGEIGNMQRRTISQVIDISNTSDSKDNPFSPSNHMVHVAGKIILNGNTHLNNIIVTSPSPSEAGHTINGKFDDKVKWNIPFNYKLPEFPSYQFSNLPSNSIDINSNTKNITLDKNVTVQNFESNSLTIDVGSSNRSIYINNLDLSNKTIKIIGTGKLTIYINNLTVDKDAFINPGGNKDNLQIYVNNHINLNKSLSINGSLYSNNEINVNKDLNVTGDIIIGKGDFHLNGNSTVSANGIYAPNSTVHFNGGNITNIKSNIIVNEVIFNGNSTINGIGKKDSNDTDDNMNDNNSLNFRLNTHSIIENN